MTPETLLQKAEIYLQRLCEEIPNRRVGGVGNQAATQFFAGVASSFGFETHCPAFDCIDWTHLGASLSAGGLSFTVFPSPYSKGCLVSAPLAVVSTMEELETTPLTGTIALLRGEVAKEQLMPKNFPLYNPDHHRRMLQRLEAQQPQAVIAATSRDVQMVGSQYPFPLFEDGDFEIPSVYMTEEEGVGLADLVGQEVSLVSRACRIPTTACNVIARKGLFSDAAKGVDASRRVVLFAHIDARMGTPGANDNASGVVVLLLLAELLAGYGGGLGIELVAMNGEDYYSNPGEQQYLALNAGRFGEILLGISLDDVAYRRGRIAYSLYGCPNEMADLIRELFSAYQGLIEGEPWFQGDHGLFLMKERPALAITSELLAELMSEFTHTPRDTPEIVDPSKLVTVALALRDLLLRLEERL